MIPHGGAIVGPTQVRLLTVHPEGTIHYTVDGSPPDASSPRYDKPLSLQPGQTLRAIAVREGLKPSPVTTGSFVAGPSQPAIRIAKRSYEAQIGKPFRAEFQADNADGAFWSVGGKTGEQYREFGGQRFNPPRHIAWMQMDAETGVLSGIPLSVGVFPVIVSCVGKPASDKDSQTGDAMLIVVHVKE